VALLAELKQRAHHLKAETFALYLAALDPRTPWYAKLLVAGIVAYAVSPIDLIPDFVADCRAKTQEIFKNGKPVSRVAGVVIVVIWIALAALCIVWVYETLVVRPEILFGQTKSG
jgi:hypothetical protein